MNDTNLIPMSLRIVRGRRRRLKAWGIAVTAALLLLCLPVVFDRYLRVEASRLVARKEKLGGAVAGLRQELTTLTAEADRTLVQLQRAQALRSKRAWSAMFATLARSMPEGCWLLSIATDPSRPTGGRQRPASRSQRSRATANGKRKSDESKTTIEAPQRLKIAGYASNASEPHLFVANLKATGVFRDVSLETSRRELLPGQQAGPAGAYGFRFDLVCEW